MDYSKAGWPSGILPTYRSSDTVRRENPMELFRLAATVAIFAFLIIYHWDDLGFWQRSMSSQWSEYKYKDDLCDSLERDVWAATVTTEMPVRRHNDDVSIRWWSSLVTCTGTVAVTLELSQEHVATVTWKLLCRIPGEERQSLVFPCRRRL